MCTNSGKHLIFNIIAYKEITLFQIMHVYIWGFI